jgi:hypothetical protein
VDELGYTPSDRIGAGYLFLRFIFLLLILSDLGCIFWARVTVYQMQIEKAGVNWDLVPASASSAFILHCIDDL